jgi:hypothetical protein
MVESKMIKGFPNYVINSDGTVMNVKSGRYLKPEITRNGYARVTLSAFGTTKRYLLHRLVAELFVAGRTQDRNYVDHKDNNKLNNKSHNLQWVSPKENSTKAAKDGLYNTLENHPNSKYSNELIIKIYTDYKIHNMTRKDIMIKYDVPKSLCDDVLYKKHWLSLTDKLDEQFNI